MMMGPGLGSFAAVFLPGLVVGGWSSYLFLHLWSAPLFLRDANEREVGVIGGNLGVGEPMRESSPLKDSGKGSEWRHALDSSNKSNCNMTLPPSSLLVPGGQHLSSKPVAGGPYQLLVFIHSSPAALERRDAIRETWLKAHSQPGVVIGRFVLGLAGLTSADLRLLACENMKHGDILFLPNIVEPANEMGYSSSEKLLESFVWAIANVNFHYIFKCTDRTYANLRAISEELESREATANDYLWGFFAGGVQATKEGHLREKNWTLCTHYLPYPEGGGYVVSRQLVIILDALREDLEHYEHDDIALGVWLSPFNGIERHHDVRFNTGHYSRGCHNGYLVTHKESAQSMHRKFLSQSRSGVLCEKEFSAKPSYHYNWTVPSNRCCVRDSGVL